MRSGHSRQQPTHACLFGANVQTVSSCGIRFSYSAAGSVDVHKHRGSSMRWGRCLVSARCERGSRHLDVKRCKHYNTSAPTKKCKLTARPARMRMAYDSATRRSQFSYPTIFQNYATIPLNYDSVLLVKHIQMAGFCRKNMHVSRLGAHVMRNQGANSWDYLVRAVAANLGAAGPSRRT